MGSGQSTETVSKRNPSPQDSAYTHENVSVEVPAEKPKEESGGCPMKNNDGSYRYEWSALLRPSFPHGNGGSKPLIDKQSIQLSKDNETCPVKKTDDSQNTEASCPVKTKSVEYNVYAQPIHNPSNNMPYNPNQLPASTQSVALSTTRVPSSIPKVCLDRK